VFSVDTEEEAHKLLVLTCGKTPDGQFYAKELAQRQSLENLYAFGDRLAQAYEWMKDQR
jgi:hypothetical protein